jgi:transposase-like protein
VILENSKKEEKEIFNWTIEADETYCWPSRIRWKRWRWAWMKTIVFWLLKRNWKVYTQVIPDCKASTLKPIISGKVKDWSVLNTDGWKWYDWLVDTWIEKHYRVHHWKNEFARWNKHINWIESFWSFMKRRMTKFNWIKKEKFILHLKESEFRFNTRLKDWNLEKELISLLKRFTKN